mmetsp:Transcript_5443/g.8602  ORF Transcript_5443/g.8602 Transcript_5443/m.8602 type:complete len:174 (+) Transcript_5443:308-829(+)
MTYRKFQSLLRRPLLQMILRSKMRKMRMMLPKVVSKVPSIFKHYNEHQAQTGLPSPSPLARHNGVSAWRRNGKFAKERGICVVSKTPSSSQAEPDKHKEHLNVGDLILMAENGNGKIAFSPFTKSLSPCILFHGVDHKKICYVADIIMVFKCCPVFAVTQVMIFYGLLLSRLA